MNTATGLRDGETAEHRAMRLTVEREVGRGLGSTPGYATMTADELRAAAAALAAKGKKRAGVKALVAKYGAASASRIVKRESGRTIRETPRGY